DNECRIGPRRRARTDDRKERSGIRRRTSVRRGDQGTVRSVHRCGPPERGQGPARGPDLPRSRPVAGWLDDPCDSRLPAELGTLPRQHAHAADAGWHRGWLRLAASGDDVRGRKPAIRVTPVRVFPTYTRVRGVVTPSAPGSRSLTSPSAGGQA